VALHFTWVGAPIHLLTFAVALGAAGIVCVAAGHDVTPFARGIWRYGVGFLAVFLPAVLLAPELIMKPDMFPEILAGGVVLAVGVPGWLVGARAADRFGFGPFTAAFSAVALAAGAAWGAVKLVPKATGLLGALLGEKSKLVQEHVDVGWEVISRNYGLLLPFALLAGLVALARAWRSPRRLPHLTLAVAVLVAVALWWRTGDRGYGMGPLSALLAVVGAAGLAPLARGWLARRRAPVRIALAVAAAAALLVAPAWPMGIMRPPWMARSYVASMQPVGVGFHQALRWMRESLPPPSLDRDDRVGPWDDGFDYPPGTEGVHVAWDYGHAVAMLSGLPPVASHGITGRTVRWWLLTDEATAIRDLDEGCEGAERVRWVVVDARTAGDFFMGKVKSAKQDPAPYRGEELTLNLDGRPVPLKGYGDRYRRSMAARLQLDDGRGLSHLRLVYESPHKSLISYRSVLRPEGRGYRQSLQRVTVPARSAEHAAQLEQLAARPATRRVQGGVECFYASWFGASVKVFERVPGAVLEGQVRPGAEVTARITLQAKATGRTFTDERRARADAAGRVRLVLPYASAADGAPTDVVAQGPWTVAVAAGDGRPPSVRRVSVTERQVQEGTSLPLPPR
jgi:hypothetical protein